MLNGSVRGSGSIQVSKEMAINPGNVLTQLEGIPTKEPLWPRCILDRASGSRVCSGKWLYLRRLRNCHMTIQFILLHNAKELMTFDVAQELVDRIDTHSPNLSKT